MKSFNYLKLIVFTTVLLGAAMLNSGCEKEILTPKHANDVSINSLTVNENGILTHKVHNGTMCITLQNVSVFGLSTPLDNCSNSTQPYFQSCHSEAGTTGTNNG